MTLQNLTNRSGADTILCSNNLNLACRADVYYHLNGDAGRFPMTSSISPLGESRSLGWVSRGQWPCEPADSAIHGSTAALLSKIEHQVQPRAPFRGKLCTSLAFFANAGEKHASANYRPSKSFGTLPKRCWNPSPVRTKTLLVEVFYMTLVPRIAEPLIHDPMCNEELRQRVVLHLASCRPELSRVDVLAEDGTVILRGELSTFFLRQLAAERTRRVAGVRLLVDQIEVPAQRNGFHRSPK